MVSLADQCIFIFPGGIAVTSLHVTSIIVRCDPNSRLPPERSPAAIPGLEGLLYVACGFCGCVWDEGHEFVSPAETCPVVRKSQSSSADGTLNSQEVPRTANIADRLERNVSGDIEADDPLERPRLNRSSNEFPGVQ